jgi:hypothetical protein
MLVGTEEILRAAMDIREVAASAARDEDFLTDAIGTFEDRNAASAFAGLGRAEKTRGAGAENDSVKFVRQWRQVLAEPLAANCPCVRSSG